MQFLPRHRHILAYSHKYVITAEDLLRPRQETTAEQTSNAAKSEAEVQKMVEHLLGDFDAATDETDRRIFFEVTGRQLIKGEF